MGELVIKCPNTGKEVNTGIGVGSKKDLENNTFKNNKVNCPHCPEIHTWDGEDAEFRE